ncbi:MAG: TIGR03790 family protein [Candidatus Aenigmarchaeota archaeon]|nr:TIGR03790 family protein [Candidatus Aenigmarchaeota archaeon]
MEERKIIVIVLSIFFILLLVPPVFASGDSPGLYYHVLVVYNTEYTGDDNSNSVQDSLEIANYYIRKRNIPPNHVCPINTSTSETITRQQYDQDYDTGDAYPNNTHIRQAIESCLNNSLKETIKFIVLAKGIPLKINTYQSSGYGSADYSSLEGSLVMLFNNNSIYWRHQNPYFTKGSNLDLTERFVPFAYVGADFYYLKPFNLSYLVTRLDGYNVTEVMGMIDRAVLTNTSMKGQWVLDDDPDCTGNTCDYMSIANTTLCSSMNLCDYVSYENTNPAITSHGDVNNNSVIGYSSHGIYGSGLGGNAIESGVLTFNVSNGAIYTSWESFNAYSYDSTEATNHNTVADWVRFGGTGGVGSVYEPWCSGISHEDILFSRYAAGYTFAEAAYSSIEYVDFITSVAGDPIMTIVPDNDPPTVTIDYPVNYTRMNAGTWINFTIFEDYPDVIWIDTDGSYYNFTYPFVINTSGWSTGIHNVTIHANDTRSQSVTKKYMFEINTSIGDIPIFTKFNGSTTQFHRLGDRTNVSKAVLEIAGNGSITFLENVNVSGLDMNTYVNITHNNISIDSQALPNLNKSANLSIQNLSYTYPIIRRDGIPCSPSICSSLNYTSGMFNFTVTSFTSYAASPNTELTIWDEVDTGMPYGNKMKRTLEQVKFFANYTNATSGLPVTGANCTIDFEFYSYNMTYNSSGFYEANRSFFDFGLHNYTVNCTASLYEPLETNDDVFVLALQLETPPVITSPSNASNSDYMKTNITWTSNGTNFTVQLDNDSDFRSPEVNVAGVMEKYFYFPDHGVALNIDESYHIRVKSNESEWGYLLSSLTNMDIKISESLPGSHLSPSGMTDSNGTLHAVWYGESPFNILYSSNADWGDVTDTTPYTSYDQYWPDIFVDSNDVVHTAWQGRTSVTVGNPNIFYANSTNWTNGVDVTGSVSYDQRAPSIAVDSSGIVHIAWHGKTSSNPDYYNIRYANSSNWSSIIEITDKNVYDNSYPSLDISPDDVIHIAWYGKNPGNTNSHIIYANSNNWSALEENIGSGGTQTVPSLMAGKNGLVHIAYSGLKGMYMNIRYANSNNWTEEVKITDQTDYDQMFPSIGLDDGESVHISWTGRNSESPTIDNIFYANDGGWNDIVMITNSPGNQERSSTAVDGSSVHLVWRGENEIHYSNNIGYFTAKDTTSPLVMINNPQNTTVTTDLFNFSYNETVSWTAYSVDGGINVTNSSVSGWTGTFTSLSDGFHNITVWANDSSGNMNYSVRFWTRNIDPPQITINNPVNSIINSDSFLFSYNEVNCSVYSVNGESNVTNCSVVGNSWSGTMGGLSDGINNITVWANDSSGNMNYSVRFWTRDTALAPPDINNPINNTVSSDIFNFSYSEVGCSVYSADGKVNVTNCSVTGNEWAGTIGGLNDGIHNITVWVNDSAGNWNYSQRFWTREFPVFAPVINSPVNSTISSDAFNFTYYVVNCSVYSLDGGANVTNCSIPGVEWTGTLSGLLNGFHNITVWVNNSQGEMNYSVRYWTRYVAPYVPPPPGGSSPPSWPGPAPSACTSSLELSVPGSIEIKTTENISLTAKIKNTGTCSLDSIMVETDLPGGWAGETKEIESLEEEEETELSLKINHSGKEGNYSVYVNAETGIIYETKEVKITVYQEEKPGLAESFNYSVTASSIIENTELLIREATEKGIDIEEAANFLDQAKYYLEGGNYTQAMSVAQFARNIVERKLRSQPTYQEIDTGQVSFVIFSAVFVAIVLAVLIRKAKLKKTNKSYGIKIAGSDQS